jgi:hypothetical protein
MIGAVEMTSCCMVSLPSVTKTDRGGQVILRFCLRKLNGCNVEIPECKEL